MHGIVTGSFDEWKKKMPMAMVIFFDEWAEKI
jgi:hypothetical protein